MQSAAKAGGGPHQLTDVLGLVAMQGQADIVARVGLGLNRATWSDADLWRACINVVFGETKVVANDDHRFESTARTRLMMYLDRGKSDLVKLALGNGADPNLGTTFVLEEVVHTIRTPLQCALEKKIYSLVGLLLKHGADPNGVFRPDSLVMCKKTPLELASEKDSLPIVRLLVDEYGAKVPGAFPLGEIVPLAKISRCKSLGSAIRNNNFTMVQYFVKTKGVRLNYPDFEDYQWNEEVEKWNVEEEMIDAASLHSYLDDALLVEAAEISLNMVTYLLDGGAVMNFDGAVHDKGYCNDGSPLFAAVNKRRMDVVTLLLARGADANLASSYRDESPIIAAAENNDLQMANVLVNAGANVLASIRYNEDHEFLYISSLLAEGFTALHHFVEYYNAEGIALMLREGAEVDAVTFSDMTPLLLVAKGVGEDASAKRIAAACRCCQLLVDAGADVNHVRELPEDFDDVDLEGNPDERVESSFTALTYATEFNAPALVRCLIGLGADITHCTEHSFSLLMRAASKGYFEVLEILVEAAKALSQEEKAALFEKKYLDANPENESNGRSALHFCLFGNVQGNRVRCAKVLIDADATVKATFLRKFPRQEVLKEDHPENEQNGVHALL